MLKDTFVLIRNWLSHFFYKTFVRKIFFFQDPESAHERTTKIGGFLGSSRIACSLIAFLFGYSNKMLEQNIFGIHFKNPVGLAAGFDKDALLTDIIPFVGFGFEEVGSITAKECAGNPRPRIWRLKKSRALVVYYGLKNDGCEAIASRLRRKKFLIPLGTSIAKTNSKETIDTNAGIADYAAAFQKFADIGDYFAINISCPNAFGGQPFHETEKLDLLLSTLKKNPTKKPMFLKLSPDLLEHEINGIIEIAEKYSVAGFICSNLTKKRDGAKIAEKSVSSKGGISGKIVEEAANNLIEYIYKKTNGSFVIIGCGGIFSAEDAYKKIKFGSSLVQLITGMIFEGPQLISEINQGLVRLLKKDGYKNISEAIGVDVSLQ